ncbi:MAG: hypothetical protein ACWGQW_20990 [bacterium]
MGIFSAISTGAKLLLGAGTSSGADNVMEVARGVGSWIDEQQFTDQEKSETMLKIADKVAGFVEATANENSARSITRRAIALWIIRAEILLMGLSGVAYPFNKEWSEYLFKLGAFDAPVGWLALGACVFFFGVHMLRTYVGGK